jgi:hypothetical protein
MRKKYLAARLLLTIGLRRIKQFLLPSLHKQ